MVFGRIRRRSQGWTRLGCGSLSVTLIATMLLSSVVPALASSSARVVPASLVTALTEEDITTTFPSNDRSSGANRIQTALAISRDITKSADAVVIATSANFPDALAGTPLADAANGPILLTPAAQLDAGVRTRLLELKAGGATKAYLIGGTAALAPAVQTAVAAVFGAGNIQRIGGASRYETSSLIATELAKLRPVAGVVLASGETYPDALSAAGWAAFSGQAILLTKRDTLPAATAASLAQFGHTPTTAEETGTAETGLLVVGGTGAISDAVAAPYPGMLRIGGANRYETSAMIAQHAWEWGMPSESVGLATGLNFPDALAAGPWCADNGAPLLLMNPAALPAAAQGFLAGHASTIKHLQVFGGTVAVPKPVLDAAAEAAKVMMSKQAPIASAATDALLSEVTSDTLVFEDENAQLDTLEVGWVLRSNPTSAAPDGYFRKIVGIENNPDGSVSYETTTAAITDVLLKGSVDMVMPCGEEPVQDAQAHPAAPGIHPAEISGEKSFGAVVKFALTPSLTFDGAGGSKVTFGAKGSLNFSMTTVVSIVVDGRWESGVLGVPYWETYISKYEQYLSYKGAFALSYAASGKIDVFEVPVGPQIPIAAEPVITGFLVKPEAQLMLKGSIGIEVSVTSTFVIAETKTGLRYTDARGWEPLEDRPDSGSRPSTEPQLKGSGSVEIGIGAEIGVSICDFVGPYLEITLLSGKAEFTVVANPDSVEIKISIGTSVGGGLKADLPIVGKNLAKIKVFKVDFTYFEWTWKAAHVTPPPPPPPPPPATGETLRVSTSASGVQGDLLASLGGSSPTAISSDGRYIAFYTTSALVPDDTNNSDDIYRKDLTTGETVRISSDSSDGQAIGGSRGTAMSADARYVAFASDATNLVSGDTNGQQDVFLKDTVTGATTRISTATGGSQSSGNSYGPAISSNGRYIAFTSWATNLVAGDTNACADVFVKDTTTGETTRVSTNTSGVQANSSAEDRVSISADGRYVVWMSAATNLHEPTSTTADSDIFLKDRNTNETILISEDSYGQPAGGESRRPAITPDGRYVVFDSSSATLVEGDTAGFDVFVKEIATGLIERVSTDSSGGSGNGIAEYASISDDGKAVTFMSSSSDLTSGDTNGEWDIFVKWRTTGGTSRVSVDFSAVQSNGYSQCPQVSGDGRYIAFDSYASNLVVNDTNGVGDVFRKYMGVPPTGADLRMGHITVR